MAANEFEKNVRKEMDEFKLSPSQAVWPKIEERIREKSRKRRFVFFVLFSLIGLMLAGYGIYNFSGSKTKPEARFKVPAGDQPNTENKKGTSENSKPNKETITIKPTVPTENSDHAKPAITNHQQVEQSNKVSNRITPVSKGNPASPDQTTLTISRSGEKKDNDERDNSNQETLRERSNNQQLEVVHSGQSQVSKSQEKNLVGNETTRSKLEELKDTRSVQVVNKKKEGNVSDKIMWGINFSAGRSVITEDAFSLKSSYATADRQYSTPGSNVGGTPSTGTGGPGGPSTYYSYSQLQNKPACAFKAGINARKNISKRSSLSAGLGYSYLADKIEIGTNQASSQSAVALFYYSGSPQQTHTDHFHFIELPLTYNWRVTNSADHFLSLNAGVSPSYLLASNALLYDTAMGGIYYHNKDLLTKAHFNLISGVSYQFKNKKNLEFSIGPQFNFDITKVFKSDLDKRKYLLYTGIDARIFFAKKAK